MRSLAIIKTAVVVVFAAHCTARHSPRLVQDVSSIPKKRDGALSLLDVASPIDQLSVLSSALSTITSSCSALSDNQGLLSGLDVTNLLLSSGGAGLASVLKPIESTVTSDKDLLPGALPLTTLDPVGQTIAAVPDALTSFTSLASILSRSVLSAASAFDGLHGLALPTSSLSQLTSTLALLLALFQAFVAIATLLKPLLQALHFTSLIVIVLRALTVALTVLASSIKLALGNNEASDYIDTIASTITIVSAVVQLLGS